MVPLIVAANATYAYALEATVIMYGEPDANRADKESERLKKNRGDRAVPPLTVCREPGAVSGLLRGLPGNAEEVWWVRRRAVRDTPST